MSDINVGPVEGFSSDVGTVVDVGGTAVAVFCIDNAVYAIADRCSHAEASLSEGDVFDGEIECPRHGASFDIQSGAALTLPATQPVRTYTTHVRNGDLYITSNSSEDDR